VSGPSVVENGSAVLLGDTMAGRKNLKFLVMPDETAMLGLVHGPVIVPG
jgi:hypothetical protein